VKESVKRGCILLVLLLFFVILATPATAYTTEVTVRRLATDGLTPVTETTRTYQWLEANLPVSGDGNTYYYFQGPIFEGEWEANYGVLYPDYLPGGTGPAWTSSEESWDRYWNGASYIQNEEVNWQTKNLGKLKGTRVKDLCDLVGGVPVGQKVRVLAADNVYQDLPYSAIYAPTPELGPYVITWWSVDAGESGATNGYTGPDYTNGMRATFFADTSRNPSGEHVAGLGDQAEGIPEAYWYYYGGQYPSMGGWTLKYVDRIYVYSNDPVPVPQADFIANTKTGLIQNGNFEILTTLSPWTYNLATRHTGSATYRHGNASVKLAATVGTPAWIQQDVDLSTIGSVYFWRYTFGGAGKYLQVLVDDTVVANYTETVNVPNKYETVDISSYNFTGTHTLKFNAVSATSGTFTVYLDDIEDYGPGTSGNAPLTVQFKDLSTKMQDTAHTSWAWDFYNNGTATSTQQNPQFTYSTPGTYTVKLTATNAGGSDPETKTGYIVVTSTTPTIDVDATGTIAAWDLQPNADNEDSTSIDLSVTTTAASWNVIVSDASANPNKGHMSQWVDGTGWTSLGKYLATKMQVKAKETDSYVAADSNSIIIDQADGTGSYNIWLKQTTVPGDSALATGVYRVEITFTGSVN
jgi:PKD repeat protein